MADDLFRQNVNIWSICLVYLGKKFRIDPERTILPEIFCLLFFYNTSTKFCAVVSTLLEKKNKDN